MVVTPPSTSLAPADAPAVRPVARQLMPLNALPSCLGPPESVGSGSPRSQRPVVAVSVPAGLRVQPRSLSKLSANTIPGSGVGVGPGVGEGIVETGRQSAGVAGGVQSGCEVCAWRPW